MDRSIVDPLAHGQDILSGRHANTTIPNLQGAARAYELTGEPAYRRAVENFWHLVQTTRQLAAGADTSCREYWSAPNAGKATLCASTQETCGSYNWLRLVEYLCRWTADPRYGDSYERGHINGVLAAQHPQTGVFVYFTPMRPGPREPNPDNYDPDPPEAGSKHFGRPLRSFWCCYGTGVQAFANPTAAVFYQRGATVWVNQYVASSAWTAVDRVPLRVDVRTDFPHADVVTVVVSLERPTRFALALRAPWWVKNDASTRLNFGPFKEDEPAVFSSNWITIDRLWRESGTITLTLPMHLYTESLQDDPASAAPMYGPHVLAACARDLPRLQVNKDRPGE